MTRFRCPGCSVEIEAPIEGGSPFRDPIGCYNVEEHEDGDPLVMYTVDEEGSQ